VNNPSNFGNLFNLDDGELHYPGFSASAERDRLMAYFGARLAAAGVNAAE
jgi:hypothetical protein